MKLKIKGWGLEERNEVTGCASGEDTGTSAILFHFIYEVKDFATVTMMNLKVPEEINHGLKPPKLSAKINKLFLLLLLLLFCLFFPLKHDLAMLMKLTPNQRSPFLCLLSNEVCAIVPKSCPLCELII